MNLEYYIKKNNIKTKVTRGRYISLNIAPNGQITLKHPSKISKSTLMSFLIEKEQWIEEKKKNIIRNFPQKLEFIDGEIIPIFGNSLRIQLSTDHSITEKNITFKNSKSKTAKLKNAKKYLIKLLEQETKPWIKFYTNEMKTKVNTVRIKVMKSLWGSCSSENKISLNLSLIHCPLFVIKYIIVHELSHTIEHNHSAKFWKIVSEHCANFKEAEKWLKTEGKYIIYYLN
ncbi:SprT family zinc-dependent metalloprotease [Leptospira sp. 96542]|nr:SprT family zinc-dependent metalloprotease [Leptospira sp. 96542]